MHFNTMPKNILKKIPQRTCIGCREEGSKRGLIRLVRCPDGTVVFDSTGRQAGRGAYICRSQICLDNALKGNKIENALRIKFSEEQRRQLIESAVALLGENTFGNG